jgi:glycosyltransferase involved in cell wall biosynthesis
MQRLLTVVGDANDINTWSNIPYFFLKAGQAQGFLTAGVSLQCDRWRWPRRVWNLKSWLTTGEYGGFQYTDTALRSLFSEIQLPNAPIEFISHFPLLPPQPWAENWRVSYYIDATLRQNFEDYGFGQTVASYIQSAALARETEQYHRADRMICMSRSGARSLVQDYGLSPTKIHVIPGGANLLEDEIPPHAPTPPPLQPVRLGFIGKDWQRKGLGFLLTIADVLQQRGIAVEIPVIGPDATTLPAHPSLRPLGFINKATQLSQFVEQVRSFHFGCLFSSAEAFGISNMECIRLGVPVLARRIGGIPDTIPQGLGQLFDPSDPPEAVADYIAQLVAQPDAYHTWRQTVMARSQEVTWATTVQRFIDVWNGSTQYRYDQDG